MNLIEICINARLRFSLCYHIMLQSSVADEIRKLRKLQIFILRWRIFRLKFENQLVEITEIWWRWMQTSEEEQRKVLPTIKISRAHKSNRKLFHRSTHFQHFWVELFNCRKPNYTLMFLYKKIFSQSRKRENWKATMEKLNGDEKKYTKQSELWRRNERRKSFTWLNRTQCCVEGSQDFNSSPQCYSFWMIFMKPHVM